MGAPQLGRSRRPRQPAHSTGDDVSPCTPHAGGSVSSLALCRATGLSLLLGDSSGQLFFFPRLLSAPSAAPLAAPAAPQCVAWRAHEGKARDTPPTALPRSPCLPSLGLLSNRARPGPLP